MFEHGLDQAAGLRGEVRQGGTLLMPVACSSHPARAYEWLCTLAAHLGSLGREAVIMDGSATEAGDRKGRDGCHLGLLHAMQDPSISSLGRAPDGAEWLVMPAARGLQLLQQTAYAAGASVALSRLLAPFSPEAVVLLYAPAQTLTALLPDLATRVLVPVLPHAQASIDAYASVKLLHTGGLEPVLAPLSLGFDPEPVPLQQVVDAVLDCATRHLQLQLDAWPVQTWGSSVLECAVGRHKLHEPSLPLGADFAALEESPISVAAKVLWS